MALQTSHHPRILCLTLRAGSVGHAVLDGFGVPTRSFFTSRLDHLPARARVARIAKILTASCEKFRPTRVVLGFTGRQRPERIALANRVLRRLQRIRFRPARRRLADAARVLVDRMRYRRADELVDDLVAHFVPELASRRTRGSTCAWYWRPAWAALTIALAELTEHHPLAAAALARPSAFSLQPFRAALTSASARRTRV